MHRRRIILFIMSLLLISGNLVSERGVQATPMTQSLCFPETPQIHHCIGQFHAYWHENGGLPIFGYPISYELSEYNSATGGTYTAQWFERNRFEAHPANRPPYHVLLGRLGVDRLQQLGRNWESMPKAPTNAPHYFAETGHAIAHRPFWNYWSSHGLEFDGRPGKSYEESLALFGLPLSEPAIETNAFGDRVLTQWFERARFEDHSAKGVLLGLLGNEVQGPVTPYDPYASLQYFWPRFSPMTIWNQGDSYADRRGFALHLAMPHATEPDVSITGGHAVTIPEGSDRRVTIRWGPGSAYVIGTRIAIVWGEGERLYMITGTLPESELIAFANELEALDLATFRTRLRQEEPPTSMQYFWPRLEEHELSVLPEPHGGSFANGTSLKLNLYRTHHGSSHKHKSPGWEARLLFASHPVLK